MEVFQLQTWIVAISTGSNHVLEHQVGVAKHFSWHSLLLSSSSRSLSEFRLFQTKCPTVRTPCRSVCQKTHLSTRPSHLKPAEVTGTSAWSSIDPSWIWTNPEVVLCNFVRTVCRKLKVTNTSMYNNCYRYVNISKVGNDSSCQFHEGQSWDKPLRRTKFSFTLQSSAASSSIRVCCQCGKHVKPLQNQR